MQPIDLEQLRKRVEEELNNYVYYCPPTALGRPFPAEKVQKLLDNMRSALVAPYWIEVEIQDTFEQVRLNQGPRQPAVVVAEDENEYLLVFDPIANEFMLAMKSPDRRITIGVRGDAVGCYMAR